jgi:TPP-dependent pyruvate/acetoin dehydrogenase alpha subunit
MMPQSPWDPEGVDTVLDAAGGLADASAAEGLDLRAHYKTLVQARTLDAKLRGLGLPMYAPFAGEEAVQVSVGTAVGPEDWIWLGPRDHGCALARGVDAEEIVRQLIGDFSSLTRGAGLPSAICDARARLAPGSESLGVYLGTAAGHARGQALARQGHISVALLGEGLTTTGPANEAIALSTMLRLPILFVCKSRPWPEGAPPEAGQFGDSVAERLQATGMWTRRADGADAVGVHQVIRDAIERVRDGDGPGLIEVVVTPMLQDAPPERDPIERLRRHLEASGEWTQTFQDVVEAEIRGRVDKVIKERGS